MDYYMHIMSADFVKQDCFFSQSGTRFLSIYNVCACLSVLF